MALFPPLKPHFHAALRDATSTTARTRAIAADVLGDAPEGREDEAKRSLRPLLDDPDPAVRSAAIASLGRLRDEEALDVILLRFEDGDPMVRQIAIIAAGEVGDRTAVPALKRALRSDAAEIRFQALASLAMLDPDEAIPALARLAEDPDRQVREHLVDALAALEDPRTRGTLTSLLEDEVREVRQGAAIGLARIGDDRGAATLIDTLEDEDRCFEAAWALGELRVERAKEPLARILSRMMMPLATKAAAAAALVRLGDPRGEPALRSVLRALRSDARSYAVGLVGELGLTSFAPDLAKLATRPRGADPVAVAIALGKLAADSDVARQALEGMARRDDEGGAEARRILDEPPPE